MTNNFNDFLLDDNKEPTFYGQILPIEVLDYCLYKYVGLGEVEALAQLTNTCWFDYRFFHPMARIFYFADLYYKTLARHKMHSGQSKSINFVHRSHPFEGSNKSTITRICKTALLIDYYCIPYDFWLEKALEFSISIGSHFTPNFITSVKTIREVLKAWEERNRYGIFLAKSCAYNCENHHDNVYAEEYKHYLIFNIENKANRSFFVWRLVNDIGHLTQEDVEQHFKRE